MKKTTYIALFVLLFTLGVSVQAQRKVVLDLEGTVRLAVDSSFTAQKLQSDYNVARFNYLSWQASRKPQVLLESTSELSFDQRHLYTQGGINVTQVFEPLGGTFYGSTQLGYMRTFGQSQQFMTTPVALGYRQESLFFNPLKWDKRIEALRLTYAEKELFYGMEAVSEEAVGKFFSLALAQDQLQMAEEYLAACDTIYAIAERRYKISSISKADLSILELEKTNAQMTLANARIDQQRAMQELASFLRMGPDIEIELIIPEVVQDLQVNAAEAIQHARDNNPRYIESRQAITEALRDAEKARIEKNLNLGIDLSVSLNQVASTFPGAYLNLVPQDVAALTLSMPLVDWGKRRNAYQSAQNKVEAAQRTAQEAARDTELDVALTVADFNERKAIVETARQAFIIADEAYAQTMRQFISAQASTYALTWALSCWQTARKNQIASLKNYWIAYYHLQYLTLYDFQRQQVITSHGNI